MPRILKVNELFKNNKGFCILLHNKDDYDQLMIELEKNGYKWPFEKLPTMTHYTDEEIIWAENNIITCSNFNYFISHNETNLPLIDVKDYLSGKKIKRIVRPDLDPYNEEDWGWSVQENKNYLNKDLGILIKTKSEYDLICKKLEEIGYNWGSKNELPTKLNFFKEYGSDYVLHLNPDNTLTYASLEFYKEDYPDLEIISVDEYLSGKINKRKRIERPDVDPYDEDNWGYENESKLNEAILFIDDVIVKNGDQLICIKNTVNFYKDYNDGRPIIYPIKKGEIKTIQDGYDDTVYFTDTPSGQGVYPLKDFSSLSDSKRIRRPDIDPYGEEDWGYQVQENKINELFETEQSYNYKFVKKRNLSPFVDYIYTFTSRDNIVYYVTLAYNKDVNSMSVKFTDKAHFDGIINTIKDKYVDMDKFDAINVLNTIVKICKDFYDNSKNIIKSFTTSTLDEKRLRIYKYILKKYFKGWEVESYFDPRGGIVINCEPKANESHENIDPYGEEDWDDLENYKTGDRVICLRNNLSRGITVGKEYIILDFFLNDRNEGDPKIMNDNGVISCYMRDRFQKVKLNESHEDIDPYNEEDWDNLEDYGIGDNVICLDNTYGITHGKIYTVLDIDSCGDLKIINNNGEKLRYHRSRFQKVKLNESHEDIDPYGEDDWEEVDLIYCEDDLKYGDKVICLRSYNAFGITVGKTYRIIDFSQDGKNVYLINDDGGKACYVKNRFKKVKLNENIHSDIDPYGEEDWDEDEDDDFNIGDTLICTNSQALYSGVDKLYIGREYTVIDNLYGLTVKDNETGRKITGWKEFRFKKKK